MKKIRIALIGAGYISDYDNCYPVLVLVDADRLSGRDRTRGGTRAADLEPNAPSGGCVPARARRRSGTRLAHPRTPFDPHSDRGGRRARSRSDTWRRIHPTEFDCLA